MLRKHSIAGCGMYHGFISLPYTRYSGIILDDSVGIFPSSLPVCLMVLDGLVHLTE